jgi:tetratricopeptide (TPR) repeat protein
VEDVNEQLKEMQNEALGYMKKGQFNLAIDVYQKMLEKYKDDDYASQIAYSNLGVICLNQKKLGQAEAYLKKALSFSPLEAEYHHVLGMVFLLGKRPKEAIEEFKICLKQKPNNEEYLRVMAVALFDAGKHNEALQTLTRISSLTPATARILASEAADWLAKGNPKKARERAEQAMGLDPTNKAAKKVIKEIEKGKTLNSGSKALTLDAPFSVYEIKIKLKGISPPIWRRFQIAGDVSLFKLHLAIQALMHWGNYHLFEFEIGGTRYGIPDPDDEYDTKDARRYKLNKMIVGEKTRINYIYDFGDGWENDLVVEKILPAGEKLKHPVCTGGKRAAPPEDSGGIGGYADYLEILRTPPPANPDDEDEEIKSRREWIGADFDPEFFDIEAVNDELREIR